MREYIIFNNPPRVSKFHQQWSLTWQSSIHFLESNVWWISTQVIKGSSLNTVLNDFDAYMSKTSFKTTPKFGQYGSKQMILGFSYPSLRWQFCTQFSFFFPPRSHSVGLKACKRLCCMYNPLICVKFTTGHNPKASRSWWFTIVVNTEHYLQSDLPDQCLTFTQWKLKKRYIMKHLAFGAKKSVRIINLLVPNPSAIFFFFFKHIAYYLSNSRHPLSLFKKKKNSLLQFGFCVQLKRRDFSPCEVQ